MNRYVPILSLLVVCITLFLLPRESHAASIIRAPNNLGLVGYWSFDEGRGTQVSDLSGNTNDGVVQGAPEWGPGRVRGALNFDGVADYVTIGQTIDWNSQDYTTNIWFKLDSFTPLGDSSQVEFRIFYGAGTYDFLDMSVSGSNFSFSGETNVNNQHWNLGNTGVPKDTDWHMLTVTFTDGGVSGYLDGTHFSTVDTSGTSQIIRINSIGRGYQGGEYGHSYGDHWLGSFDEFRIYSRALAPSEIQTLYNNTKGVIVGTANNTYTDGLVAHYTFDGSTISGTTVQDVAGGNNGAINGTVTPVIGRIGQGVSFLGASAHYIAVPHSTDFDVTELTLATWIKTPPTMNCGSSCYRALFSKQDGGTRDYNLYTHTSDGDTVTRLHFSSSTFGSHAHNLPTALEPNTWHHVAVTVASNGFTTYYIDGTSFATSSGSAGNANGNYPLWIGRADNSWNGLMDDVRVYNRALSPEEIRGLAGSSIATLHSSSDSLVTSGLVGHWSFDSETISGSTVSDMSVNKNHGTISGSGSVTQISGAVGGALEFSGSSPRVAVGNPSDNSLNFGTEDFSLSLWVRVGALPYDWKTLVTKGASGSVGYEIEIDSGNRYTCSIQATGGSNIHRYGPVATLGKWQHVVCIYDRDVGIIQYVDGEFVFSEAFGGGNTNSINTSYPFTVGARETGGWAFSGGLDDIRVYSRALSESEVQTLYSMGQ